MNAGMKAHFDRQVEKWKAYRESPLGRMRRQLCEVVLKDNLPYKQGVDVLDAGCGLADTGGLWLERNCRLHLSDYAPAMLDEAKKSLLELHPARSGLIRAIAGPVERLSERRGPGSFDIVLCHTLLEYVDDPAGTLGMLAGLLREGGYFSLMVVNCHSESLRMALLKRDPVLAASALEQKVFSAGLFEGATKKTFSLDDAGRMLRDAGLGVRAEFGLRIFSDFYSDEELGVEDFFSLALGLEKAAMGRHPYKLFGRYFHLIAEKPHRGKG